VRCHEVPPDRCKAARTCPTTVFRRGQAVDFAGLDCRRKAAIGRLCAPSPRPVCLMLQNATLRAVTCFGMAGRNALNIA